MRAEFAHHIVMTIAPHAIDVHAAARTHAPTEKQRAAQIAQIYSERNRRGVMPPTGPGWPTPASAATSSLQPHVVQSLPDIT
ncbi:hypothetical protein [Mycobacteroides abscessus]|uniref:hypothetical protein n=1 Tax=Mycobacteroides abscessus TaxID=36809 RepID=UPI0014040C90|nr:hypothetical protein [Mycobacteroides abscessus]